MSDVKEQNDKSPEQIPYFGAHELPEDLDPLVNGPFRNTEEEEFRDARRKGKALEWLREQSKKEQERRAADEYADRLAGTLTYKVEENGDTSVAHNPDAPKEDKKNDDSAKADGKK